MLKRILRSQITIQIVCVQIGFRTRFSINNPSDWIVHSHPWNKTSCTLISFAIYWPSEAMHIQQIWCSYWFIGQFTRHICSTGWLTCGWCFISSQTEADLNACYKIPRHFYDILSWSSPNRNHVNLTKRTSWGLVRLWQQIWSPIRWGSEVKFRHYFRNSEKLGRIQFSRSNFYMSGFYNW